MTRMVANIRSFRRRGAASEQAQPPCQVCLATGVTSQRVTNTTLDRSQNVRVCPTCGYVEMPENTHDYTTATSTEHLGLAPRCGTEDRPGREYGMAQLGVEVLGGTGLSVMIYGVGRSMDNLHVDKLPAVSRTVIGDIMKIRDDGEFIDISGEATETFDVVVASEVVEHFLDPRVEFAKLFGWVAPGGILICSTNIHDGGNLDHQRYIFGRGHVSYYSPEALRVLAKANDWRVDFRLPLSAAGQAGIRKRYVIFARSAEVMDGVSDFFGRHPYGPSEPPGKIKRPGAKRRAGAGRGAGPTGKPPNARA
jgi:SAM-dependent methyltransferase